MSPYCLIVAGAHGEAFFRRSQSVNHSATVLTFFCLRVKGSVYEMTSRNLPLGNRSMLPSPLCRFCAMTSPFADVDGRIPSVPSQERVCHVSRQENRDGTRDGTAQPLETLPPPPWSFLSAASARQGVGVPPSRPPWRRPGLRRMRSSALPG